ncbi:chemotaxis protein CheW [Acidihalobacter yilgarnensis]|uniref:Chemotaxis protein CheW n=1 Tax=Acidihalobacter yilgarnensis TaxID=2819280 RepID=A0A1D8IQ12_9GAMM|nr:chemotaxis protein CheW [Acidihalobacter yilgarnensis]AOU98541.1 chemotaxis protein CheW [Acidihalobacter yilgarnensis]
MANPLELANGRQVALAEGDVPDQAEQYLSFTLGDETFAVNIKHIREIIEYEDVTTVPMMPAFLRGVINLRGRVVPVIDLAVRFGRASTEIQRRTCIVIIEISGAQTHQDLGILVDSVNEVVEIAARSQERPPAFGAGLRNDFIEGIGKVDGRFIVVLDIDQALSVAEMSALAESANRSADAVSATHRTS